MDMILQKQLLRRQIKEKIVCLDPDYCHQADKQIRQWILNWEYFQKAETIFCFVGTAREIHTKPLIQAALDQGKRVAVPKCISKGIMEARQIRSLGELYPGSYGIEEPGEAAGIIGPEEISLALVPCLTCSENGRRLGYGGGFYDRYLSAVSGIRAVLCRGRLMEAEIPWEPHDRLMDAVIREAGILELNCGQDRKKQSGFSHLQS